MVAFSPAPGYYLPDCDQRIEFPLPAGGAVEGETGYACTGGGDCHLLVVHTSQKKLYEAYQADVTGGALGTMCAVVWDLTKSYPADIRGEQCTSTDAAGLPVAALLFTADEVAAGSVDHAVRFILPNARMAAKVYVHPATHAGAPSGPAGLPPYGSRFRLRADYPLASLPSDAARVVARALQKYGMILADGGTIALTAADDAFTQHKWADVGIRSPLPGCAPGQRLRGRRRRLHRRAHLRLRSQRSVTRLESVPRAVCACSAGSVPSGAKPICTPRATLVRSADAPSHPVTARPEPGERGPRVASSLRRLGRDGASVGPGR